MANARQSGMARALGAIPGPVGRQLSLHYRLRARPRRTLVHGILVDVDRSWFEGLLLGLYRGNYEEREAEVLRRTLRPTDRFFEIGSAIGVMSTIACTIVGDHNVTTAEADPKLVATARHTAAINGFHPTIINAILGDSEADQSFYVRSDFWESSLTPTEGAQEILVPGRLFHSELKQAKATYLMVDIEGAEIELLARPLPASIRAICMELHPGKVGAVATQNLLLGLFAQGFVLDTNILAPQVVFLSREAT